MAMKIPIKFLGLSKNVLPVMNMFFVNKIAFFLTYGRMITYTAIRHLANRKLVSVLAAFKSIYNFYKQHGFYVTEVHGDNGFAPMRDAANATNGGTAVYLASASEHVPGVERRIRVVKERIRSVRNSLPLKSLPQLMTICLVLFCVNN